MTIEEFKYIIVHQLKNPTSVFCRLLCNPRGEDATILPNNFVSDNLVLSASEFNLNLYLTMNYDMEYPSPPGMPRYPNGGFDVRFEDGPPVSEFDLSKPETFGDYLYLEEVILYDGDKMILGMVKYNIVVKDYMFMHKYVNRMTRIAVFDGAKMVWGKNSDMEHSIRKVMHKTTLSPNAPIGKITKNGSLKRVYIRYVFSPNNYPDLINYCQQFVKDKTVASLILTAANDNGVACESINDFYYRTIHLMRVHGYTPKEG